MKKKKKEGWDAKGNGKVADMPAAPAGRSSVTSGQLYLVGLSSLIYFKQGSVKVFAGFVSIVFRSNTLPCKNHEIVNNDLKSDFYLLDATFDGGDRASKSSFDRGKDGFDIGSLMVLLHPCRSIFLVSLHHVIIRVHVVEWFIRSPSDRC